MWKFLSHSWGPTCPAYSNGNRIEINSVRSIRSGDSSNSIQFSASNHIGTHFDFPYHFDEKGKTTLDYSAENFVFKSPFVFWLTLNPGELVTVEHLVNCSEFSKNSESETDLVLIRTGANLYRNEEDFWKNGVGIGQGVARYLRERFPKLRVLGVDTISISALAHRDIGRLVHKEFLSQSSPILLIEDMSLEPMKNNFPSAVTALPLRIEGGDGAPCTVIGEFLNHGR